MKAEGSRMVCGFGQPQSYRNCPIAGTWKLPSVGRVSWPVRTAGDGSGDPRDRL